MNAWKHEFKLKSTSSDPLVTGLNWRVQDYEVPVRIHELQVWMQNYELRVQIHELRVRILKSRFQITSCEFKSMSSKTIRSTGTQESSLTKIDGYWGLYLVSYLSFSEKI